MAHSYKSISAGLIGNCYRCVCEPLPEDAQNFAGEPIYTNVTVPTLAEARAWCKARIGEGRDYASIWAPVEFYRRAD